MAQRCILCVDDEPMILSSLKLQLRSALGGGFAIELAESGEEGLEVLDELIEEGVNVPVVISDQLMPGMKGEAFLAAVHERDPRIRTILLTGQATAEAVGAAVNTARLYRFLSKPWTEADLGLTLREAVRAHDAELAIERKSAELARAREAALRFVPRDFLAMLERSRVEDVRPGDRVERVVHALFADLAGFTSLVEEAGREQAARAVHAFLDRMEALVHRHNGFVNNLEGDAVLAIFPAEADAALGCAEDAFAMLSALNREHEAHGLPMLGMGIGIASGPLQFAVLGGEDRLQCDLMGPAVIHATELESLTRHRPSQLLLSLATHDALREPARWSMRRSTGQDGVDCVEVTLRGQAGAA